MKLLGPAKLSKIIRETGEEIPNAGKALTKSTKTAEVVDDIANVRPKSNLAEGYDTIDVKATDLTKNPKTTMGADEAGFPQLKSGADDAFGLKPTAAAGGDGVDVPFAGTKDTGRKVGAAGAIIGTGALIAGAGYLGMDGETKFPSKGADKVPTESKVGTSAPAAPAMSAAPGPKMPSAEKYSAAYDALKLPDQANEYAAMQGALAKDINAANEIYGQTKDQVAAREMWDGIIKGIGHIAAGVHGQQTGLDLSGVKFDQTDWDKKRELAQSELRDTINNARMKNAISKEQIDRSYARAKDQLDVDKSQIEASERRDMQAATLAESAARRKDEMAMKLAELGIKARESGDKDTVKRLAEFKDMENKLDALYTKWSEKPSTDLKAMIAAQTQQYEAVGKSLSIEPRNLQYTVADLNVSDVPVNVHNARMKRQAEGAPAATTPNTPSPGLIKVRGPDGKPALWDPVKRQIQDIK